jgi:HAD-hyrolase-like
MILAAADKLALDLSRSWLIGDAPRDIVAGKAAGCRTILFQPQGVEVSPAAEEKLTFPPDCIANSLKEAIDFIESNLTRADSNDQPTPSIPIRTAAPIQHSPPIPAGPSHMENLAQQILDELRRRNQQDHYSDFSVSKLMAGIIQVIAVALLLLSYLDRNTDVAAFQHLIFFAIFFQILTISLLVMGKQK